MKYCKVPKKKEKEADQLDAILRLDRRKHAKLQQHPSSNQFAQVTMQVAEARQKEKSTGLKFECEHYFQ